LRELNPQGWAHHSGRSGDDLIRGFDGEYETFATRLTAVTNISRETPAMPDDEANDQPARSGERLEPRTGIEPKARRTPVAALLLGAIGIGALAVAFSAKTTPDPPDPAVVHEQRPAQRDDVDPPAKGTPAAIGTLEADDEPTKADAPQVEDEPDPPETNDDPPTAAEPQHYAIKVDPPDAELRVNGRRQPGKAPFKVTVPPGESRSLQVRKPGYETRKLDLTHGDPAPPKLALAKLKPKESGFLKVLAPGVNWAEVRLDGRKIGTTPTSKVTVPSGRHRLEIKCVPDACAEPRVLLSRWVTIDAGELRQIEP
jgi:hypothetical protein